MLSDRDLDQAAALIAQGDDPGYPVFADRLRFDTPGLRLSEDGILHVPDGPWHVTGHANRHGAAEVDPEVPSELCDLVAPELTKRWIADGLTVDQYGRPVHPDWRQLLADPRIGLPTGIGFFYRYGPNATVDPVVYRHSGAAAGSDGLELLLIKRRRGGRWALPGGFADRSDGSAHDTARREAGEETGLTDIGGQAETIVYHRSAGPLVTLHAWMENTVVLIHGDPEYLADTEPVAGDDAVDVGWFTRTAIAELDMFDVHLRHVDTALELLRR